VTETKPEIALLEIKSMNAQEPFSQNTHNFSFFSVFFNKEKRDKDFKLPSLFFLPMCHFSSETPLPNSFRT